MHLRVLSQTTTPNFLNSLGESDLKFFVGDEGGFVRWRGQGDRYELLPARKNNTWNAYDIPS